MLTAAIALTATTPAPAQNQEPIIGKNQITLTSDRLTPEALWAMGRIGSLAVSPDHKLITYTVSYYSVKQNKSHTVIYLMKADGSENTLLTKTAANESDPSFSPDSKRICFLSKDKEGKQQIFDMLTDGTDRRQLSHSEKDVEGYAFSPDHKKVILIHQVDDYTAIEKPYDDLPQATGMVIKDYNYRHWDHYVTSIPHIFVADFDGTTVNGEKDILKGEPYECPTLPFGGTEQFSWSPDSKKIVYSSRKRTGLAYALSTDSDIYCYDTESGKTTNLCKPADYKEPEIDPTRSMAEQAVNHQEGDLNVGYDTQPLFSPDGKYVAWLSMARNGYESDRTRLCIYNIQNGKKIYVTEKFESGVDAFCWNTDSRTLYFIGVWHARASVYSTNLKGNVQPIAQGDFDYTSLSLCGKDLIATRYSLSAPADIYRLTPNGKKAATVKALTNENEYFLSKIKMGDVKERWVKTTDGKQELCWVVYPPHFDPSKKYPTLLYCEGGPQSPVSQFWSYRWNLQIMAANDYIIIAPNRHGLPGFGMEWLEEISGDYSGQCMQDYLSAIDDICKESYVDKDRLGCVGASFGGYSVYYLAGHHNKRFKCFIAHDGIFNTHQQYVETEEMWFPNWDLGGAPWRMGITANPNNGMQIKDSIKSNAYTTSPHLYVDQWDTPILCIHGEKDYRIMSSQGMSAFNAAKLRGIPAELLLYPDENHWVLKPQNGILWQRTFFRWLDRWLKK